MKLWTRKDWTLQMPCLPPTAAMSLLLNFESIHERQTWESTEEITLKKEGWDPYVSSTCLARIQLWSTPVLTKSPPVRSTSSLFISGKESWASSFSIYSTNRALPYFSLVDTCFGFRDISRLGYCRYYSVQMWFRLREFFNAHLSWRVILDDPVEAPLDAKVRGPWLRANIVPHCYNKINAHGMNTGTSCQSP